MAVKMRSSTRRMQKLTLSRVQQLAVHATVLLCVLSTNGGKTLANGSSGFIRSQDSLARGSNGILRSPGMYFDRCHLDKKTYSRLNELCSELRHDDFALRIQEPRQTKLQR